MNVEKNLVFKKVEGLELTGDIYRPNTAGLKPAVVVVHGGGWTSRTGDMSGLCRQLARSGYVAFNITYRLAPKHRYPKNLHDVRDAIFWIQQNAKKFDIDVNRLAGWGYSAGAHLILLAGLDPAMNLKAIVAGGTPTYLPTWPHSPLVHALIGGSLETYSELWEQASPVNHVQNKSPAVFIYHGQWDKLVEVGQAHRLKQALEKKQVPFEIYIVQALGHVAVYLFSRTAVKKGLDFLARHC